jgi:HK97 gp10 family phage protein
MSTKEFGLQGVDELLGKLSSISEDAKFKGGKLSLRRAAKFIADKAIQYQRENIDNPKTPNSIYKNIRVQFGKKRFKATGDLMFRIGVQGGAILKESSKPGTGGYTFYWRFIEFGTENVPARPFMRPALQNNDIKAAEIFLHEFKRSINLAIKKPRRTAA